jgi:hypothetical protein
VNTSGLSPRELVKLYASTDAEGVADLEVDGDALRKGRPGALAPVTGAHP